LHSLLLKNTFEALEAFNDEIREDLRTKGIDNRGEARESLRVTQEKQGSKIKTASRGVFYFEFLDKGRAPGKFPPPSVIEEWTATKPVDIPAFLVGRKIAREGTEIYKNRAKGVQLDEKRIRLKRFLQENAPKWAKQDLLITIQGLNSKFKQK